jgi:threonine/homoserine/homoserine lactone efflux protein
MTTVQVLTFGGVVALGAMSPGPDFAIVLRRSALAGRPHGMATAAGVAAGVFAWAIVAATGVAALVAMASVAFTIIKLVGAGYLVHLGVNALRSAWCSRDFRLDPNLVAALHRLLSRPAMRRCIDGMSGTVLIGLGVRLAFTSAR